MNRITKIVLVIAALAIALRGTASGQTSTWLGGPGNWSDVSKWIGGVPSTASTVKIDDGNALASVVTLNVAATLSLLTVDAGDTLRMNNTLEVGTFHLNGALATELSGTIQNAVVNVGATGTGGVVGTDGSGRTLTLADTVVNNAGALSVVDNFNGGNTVLAVTGTSTLNGTGTLTMGGTQSGQAYVLGAGTLANNSTIQGAGTIQVATLTNNGLVNANQDGATLTVTSAVNQIGDMSAAGGGILALRGVLSGTGNLSSGALSFVNLDQATFQGATVNLQPSAGGIGVVGTDGSGRTLTLADTVVNNAGALSVVDNFNGGNTVLAVTGTSTLNGTGTLTMGGTQPGQAYVLGAGTLANNSTIQGAGTIQVATLTNGALGVVDANQSGARLTISSAGSNAGILRSTGGGNLGIGGTIANTGQVNTAADGTLTFTGGTINGGTFHLNGALATELSGTIQNAVVNVGATGTGGVVGTDGSGRTLTLADTVVNNAGALSVVDNFNGGNTVLAVTGTSTLNGTGTLTMGGTQPGQAYVLGAGTLANNSTIQGAGTIQVATLTNGALGVVDANQSGARLTISSAGSNAGILRSTGGGNLGIGGTIANTGQVNTAADGTLTFTGGTINGGTFHLNGALATELSGTIQNAVVNVGATGTGGVVGTDGSGRTLTLADTVVNNAGALSVVDNFNGGNTVLAVTGTSTLNGTGTLTMGGTQSGQAYVLGAGTLANNSTIQGAGTIQVATLTNNGLVNANQDGATLTVTSAVNQIGDMSAAGGGILALRGVLSGTGNLSSGALSFVNLDQATFQGATVNLQPSAGGIGVVGTDGSGRTLTLADTVVNNAGALSVVDNFNGGNTVLAVTGTSTLNGTGTLTMGGTQPGQAYVLGAGTLANNSTIQGAGTIQVATLTNGALGVVDANQSGARLTISSAGSNAGILRSTGGGNLGIGGTIANTGQVNTAADGTLTFTGGTINGGTFHLNGALATELSGTIQNAVVNVGATGTGGVVGTDGSGRTLTLADTVVNNAGALSVVDNFNGGNTVLAVTGTSTLNGTGTLTMGGTQPGQAYVLGAGTLANNSTIQGAGTIQVATLTNNGLVNANQDGATLTVTSAFTNAGTAAVASGSTLTATALTNLAGTTLTGGIFDIEGMLRVTNASIASNAANIILDGPTSQFLNHTNSNDALEFFAINTSSGAFEVKNGRSFATKAGSFSNAGSVKIGGGSSFTTLAAYNQTGGTTTVNGQLRAGAVAVTGGVVEGNGTIDSGVEMTGGTLEPGLSTGALSIDGSLSLRDSARLVLEIGGYGRGGGYDFLGINGHAILDGLISISLINGFRPANGDVFHLIAWGSRTGDFNGWIGATIGSQRFVADYRADGLYLTSSSLADPAIPEPSTFGMVLCGGVLAWKLFRKR